MILLILSPQEAQKPSKKSPGSYKKISGQKSKNNFVDTLEETIIAQGHYKINRPLASQTPDTGLFIFVSVASASLELE